MKRLTALLLEGLIAILPPACCARRVHALRAARSGPAARMACGSRAPTQHRRRRQGGPIAGPADVNNESLRRGALTYSMVNAPRGRACILRFFHFSVRR